jgi:predicted AAA+ superfamily ATPase
VREGLVIGQLIQVCYDVDSSATKKRETTALVKASGETKCSNLLILTWDFEASETVANSKIQYLPLWKWLLNI